MSVIISPSILGYESCLDESMERIDEILSSGTDWLHIDIMRDPFIPSKNTFNEESIRKLYGEFKDRAIFDFHLMVSEPDAEIAMIERTLSRDSNRRKNAGITIHRESYRKGLKKYNSKDYDLREAIIEVPSLALILGMKNVELGKQIREKLREMKDLGYRTGLAMEPGTSLENIAPEMVGVMDMLLLMGVRSGEGGQKYMHEVTNKIREARTIYRNLMIQVDGGVNEETLREIVEAGANNLVMGSYITNAKNLTERIKQIKSYL